MRVAVPWYNLGAAGDQRFIRCQLNSRLCRSIKASFYSMKMIEMVTGLGFELWSLIPGFVNQRTGRLLQVDGLFSRNGDG